jgi:hypothetical protein
VSQEIEKAAASDTTWEVAKNTALKQLDHPFHLGNTKLPARKALHER